jgi:hypothetical protein
MSDAMSTTTSTTERRHPSYWVYELPFTAVLVLTIFGVAYETFTRQEIKWYWEALVPFLLLICIGAGWHKAQDTEARWRLVGMQALHWLAFLVVINMLLLPAVQRNFSANATGLAIFTLLALGTFTAGVHLLSWQVCLLALIMALAIPATAWIENSALFFLLVTVGLLAIVAVIWWHWRQRRR